MKRNIDEIGSAGLGDFFDIGYPGEFSPGYGALVGGALTTAGILGAKAMGKGKVKKYSYVVGGALGLAGSGVMYFLGHQRAAMLSGAVTLVEALGEAVRAHFIEAKPGYNSLGYYDAEMAGAGEIEMLGSPDDMLAAGLARQVYQPQGGIEMLGGGNMPALAASPMDVMGLYQPEMAGAWSPYSGNF